MIRQVIVSIVALVFLLLPAAAWAQAADIVEKGYKKSRSRIDEIDFSTSKFSIETRAGVSNVTGNTNSITANGNNDTLYRYRRFENRWNAGAYYEHIFSSTGDDKGTQTRFIYGTYRLDYYLNKSRSLYVGGGGFTDVIKDINVALQGFTGIRFFIFRTKKTDFSLSFGYNYTYEDRLPPNVNKNLNSITQQFSFSQKFGDIVTLSLGAEALEDVKDGHETRVNSANTLKVTMTKHLGIILGFRVRFDNRPAIDKKKMDTYTDLSLALSF